MITSTLITASWNAPRCNCLQPGHYIEVNLQSYYHFCFRLMVSAKISEPECITEVPLFTVCMYKLSAYNAVQLRDETFASSNSSVPLSMVPNISTFGKNRRFFHYTPFFGNRLHQSLTWIIILDRLFSIPESLNIPCNDRDNLLGKLFFSEHFKILEGTQLLSMEFLALDEMLRMYPNLYTRYCMSRFTSWYTY